MSWNWLRDVLQGRAFDLSEGARQDFHFYVDKSEKMSALFISTNSITLPAQLSKVLNKHSQLWMNALNIAYCSVPNP